ncbi:unnamed protein product, partial [Ixodes pacificus]
MITLRSRETQGGRCTQVAGSRKRRADRRATAGVTMTRRESGGRPSMRTSNHPGVSGVFPWAPRPPRCTPTGTRRKAPADDHRAAPNGRCMQRPLATTPRPGMPGMRASDTSVRHVKALSSVEGARPHPIDYFRKDARWPSVSR